MKRGSSKPKKLQGIPFSELPEEQILSACRYQQLTHMPQLISPLFRPLMTQGRRP
jgi:hypothetical protein